MKSGTQVDYARRRVLEHLGRFHGLATAVEAGDGAPEWLGYAEEAYRCFPDLDLAAFARG